jgi:hypothetical protein
MRENISVGQGVGASSISVAHSRAMTDAVLNTSVTIEFRGATRPIVARLNAELLPELPFLITGWPWRRLPRARRWQISVAAAADGYRVIERRGRTNLESVWSSAPEALASFTGALIAAVLFQKDDAISLHAGSVAFADGAVAVFGASFAGKSSVALHMAAQGGRLLGDDSVLIAKDRAFSFGLAPKLRLPVPADAGRPFFRFAQARIWRQQSNIAHLHMRRGEAARFGQGAKLRGLVILDRGTGAEAARLVPADRSTTVRALVHHAFAPQMSGAALVPHLASLAARIPAYTLEFSRSRDAARILRRLIEEG